MFNQQFFFVDLFATKKYQLLLQKTQTIAKKSTCGNKKVFNQQFILL
jgi:hypothetical protein